MTAKAERSPHGHEASPASVAPCRDSLATVSRAGACAFAAARDEIARRPVNMLNLAEAAAHKGISGSVAGKADVLLPDLIAFSAVFACSFPKGKIVKKHHEIFPFWKIAS